MTAAPPADPPPATWLPVGGGDLLVLVLAFGVGQTLSVGMVGDPGTGWHLRTPELILASGTWPTADPFGGPSHGAAWLANQWLGDVPLWLGWRAAGLNGVAAVGLGLVLLAYRLLYARLRADGVPWPAAFGWGVLAALGSYYAWMARPNLATFLALPALARALTLYHEGRVTARGLWWVPPLFAVWANAHGGFVAGLGTLGLAAAVEAVSAVAHPDPDGRAAAGRRARAVAVVGAGAFLATLANPYGWRLYPWIAGLLADDYFMNLNREWLSPDFHSAGAGRVELFVLLFPALLAVSRYRPNPVELAIALAWLHLALQGRRYVPIWVAVVTPTLARLAADVPAVTARLAPLASHELVRLRVGGGWVGGLLAAVGLAAWAGFGRPLEPRSPAVPEPGLRVLLDRWRPGEAVFHSPDHGGFLTLHGWPAFRVWLDDRNEVHGRGRYEQFFAVERAEPGWDARLAAWDIRWVATTPTSPLAHRLAERSADWEPVFRDDAEGDELVLFRRR